MLRSKANISMLMREVVPFPYGIGSSSPLNFYQSVRHSGLGSRFHEHITFSKLSLKKRKFIVEPKDLKINQPISASILHGDMVNARTFEFDMKTMSSRGFFRHQKAYYPPADATETAIKICRSCMNATEDNNRLLARGLANSKEKYEILTKTFEAFQHGVPNSMLYMIKTVDDVVKFYNTEVITNTPYEELARKQDLPPNLYVQKEPVRWHPDTDTKFGGVTAFNKRSTIITGLKAKKKYKPYEAKMTWP